MVWLTGVTDYCCREQAGRQLLQVAGRVCVCVCWVWLSGLPGPPLLLPIVYCECVCVWRIHTAGGRGCCISSTGSEGQGGGRVAKETKQPATAQHLAGPGWQVGDPWAICHCVCEWVSNWGTGVTRARAASPWRLSGTIPSSIHHRHRHPPAVVPTPLVSSSAILSDEDLCQDYSVCPDRPQDKQPGTRHCDHGPAAPGAPPSTWAPAPLHAPSQPWRWGPPHRGQGQGRTAAAAAATCPRIVPSCTWHPHRSGIQVWLRPGHCAHHHSFRLWVTTTTQGGQEIRRVQRTCCWT